MIRPRIPEDVSGMICHAHAHPHPRVSCVSQVERLGRELGSQSSLFAQAALDLEVLTTELETERQKNRDLVHEIQTAEVHKVKGLEAKVRRDDLP